MPIRKAVTLQTIAGELNISLQTVSKALKGKPGMSESTRQQIVQTAQRLGYFTQEQIGSLKLESIPPYPTKIKRFLLVTQAIDSVSYNQLLLQGLNDRLSRFGHQIEVLQLPNSVKKHERQEWLQDKGAGYADGLFIAPVTMQTWGLHLLQIDIPRILLSYPQSGTKVDSVVWDVYEATWESVTYLLKNGHSNIMYVGDCECQPGYILRWQAFCQAMNDHGLAVDPSLHSKEHRLKQTDWKERLRERITAVSPSAIVCGISEEVPVVYEICRELGLRVPEDISLIGFLNEQTEQLPLFTRPILPIHQVGYRAADRMLWRIANPTLPIEHIRIDGDFFVGETTAARLSAP